MNTNNNVPKKAIFLDDQVLLVDPLSTRYLTGLTDLDLIVSKTVKTECNKIEKYVKYDKSFTAGFVVINKAYVLNCFCPDSPGINSCKFPTRCPIKNKIKNPPDSAAKAF
jgi:hypothetical protein